MQRKTGPWTTGGELVRAGWLCCRCCPRVLLLPLLGRRHLLRLLLGLLLLLLLAALLLLLLLLRLLPLLLPLHLLLLLLLQQLPLQQLLLGGARPRPAARRARRRDRGPLLRLQRRLERRVCCLQSVEKRLEGGQGRGKACSAGDFRFPAAWKPEREAWQEATCTTAPVSAPGVQ